MGDIKGEHIVERLIMSEDANLIQGKYICDKAKVKAYKEGVKLLENLHKIYDGFDFKADDVNIPRYIHEIEITWKEIETNLPGQSISEILSKFDDMIFSRERVLADKWLLSSEIYKEIKDDSKQSETKSN